MLTCGAAFEDSTLDLNLVTTTQSLVGFSIECNTPFRLDASAETGELRRIAGYSPADPQTFIAYTIDWPFLADNAGQPIAPNFSATSSAWADGLTYSSGNLAGFQSGLVRVFWSGDDADILLAGDYRDSLTITITALN